MSLDISLFLVAFPTGNTNALHWWHVVDGEMCAKGCDADPLSAAGIAVAADQVDPVVCIALAPSALATVRWHKNPDDVTEKQALALAVIAVREDSLDPENLHIAAATDQTGEVAAAAISRDAMEKGLEKLQLLGIDPDMLVPVGWLITPEDGSIISANFGFDRLLRANRMIVPDEPSLRAHLIGDENISTLSDSDMDQTLIGASENSAPNLRSGIFAKTTHSVISTSQKRTLLWLVAALLLLSAVIPLAQIAKYHGAAGDADEAALASVRSVLGKTANLGSAEKRLDASLIEKNRGNIVFSVPASTLFSAIQQAPGVSIERLSYRQDGAILAGLSAIKYEDINLALIAMQDAGFLVTTTPRTDATGSAKSDITVRAP